MLGDEDLLVTALRNLLDNAVAYSPDKTKVVVSTTLAGQDIVELSVTDQGIGIPERDLERIFERFYRVDPARSRVTGGTGLGLAIVKHVTAAHGGKVTVTQQGRRGIDVHAATASTARSATMTCGRRWPGPGPTVCTRRQLSDAGARCRR